MLNKVVLRSKTLDGLNKLKNKWSEENDNKVVDVVSEHPLDDGGDYRLHVTYDDGRKNVRWTEGGNSIK